MNNQVVLTEKKWYQSSNFYTYLVLMIGALIVNSSGLEEAATGVINNLFGLIAGGKAIHNFVKGGIGIDWSQLKNSNFYGYLAMVVGFLTPVQIPEQLWVDLQTITGSLLDGNWQGAIGAVLSFIVIIANIIKSTGEAKKTAKA